MLKNYSVQKINRISRKKEIWCYGCGKRLYDILDLYTKEAFIERISMLLDSNPALWGTERTVKGRQVLIQSPDRLEEGIKRDVVLLITSDCYEEIYGRISAAVTKAGIVCSKYPSSYYSYSVLLLRVCSLVPLKRQMLFRAGREPHENAKAMAEYLTERYCGRPYRLIFTIGEDEESRKRLKSIIYVGNDTLKNRNSFKSNLKYCFYMATSKYLFYENEPLKKIRRRQKLIYLNHGTIPLKNVRDVLRQPEAVDYALCPSEGCSEVYIQQYNIPKRKLLYGMPPRDDFLRKEGHRLSGLIGGRKEQIIIWLPTFRKLVGTGRKDSAADSIVPLIPEKEGFREINGYLEKNGQILLIKSHPREAGQIAVSEHCGNIILISDSELEAADLVLQEILGDTAALLTDYSGISFEYLLLDRPMGYIINDMEDYTRGFAFEHPLEFMPGTLIGTMGELKGFLDDVKAGRDAFREKRKELKARLFQGNEEKCGSQELVRQLEELGSGRSIVTKRRGHKWI